MGNVNPFPGLEGLVREPWQFLINAPDGVRERQQTFAEDPRVITAIAYFDDENFCAEIVAIDEQWRWEVENIDGDIEDGFKKTLAAAVTTAEAFVTRSFRAARNHFVVA